MYQTILIYSFTCVQTTNVNQIAYITQPYMPRKGEIVSTGVGKVPKSPSSNVQCGIDMATHFWDFLREDHAISSSGSMENNIGFPSVFFRETGLSEWKARHFQFDTGLTPW